jgi:hypothetical protein
MFICDLNMAPSSLAAIKALNPNILIFSYLDICLANPNYSYWSTLQANPSWFMYDTAGNKIMIAGSNDYLMDISSQGYQRFFTSYVNSMLCSSTNGLYCDDVWNNISGYPINQNVVVDAVNNSMILTINDLPNWCSTSWHSNMISFLEYIKSNITSGMKVIINTTDESDNTYLNAVDGEMFEGFFYGSWNTVPVESISDINTMIAASATGKILLIENSYAMPSPLDSVALAEIAQNANFCYAATLLGMNGTNCYFGYNVEYDGYNYDTGTEFMPTLVTNLGSPTDSYYLNQNVYMRDFTNGIVLLNPSDDTYTFNLGNYYQFTNGTMVSSVVLGPWSGEILLF